MLPRSDAVNNSQCYLNVLLVVLYLPVLLVRLETQCLLSPAKNVNKDMITILEVSSITQTGYFSVVGKFRI